MEPQPTNCRREFFKSPHHAALGLLTLGLGFISAHLLGLIAGATAYALGWIYLPDVPLFRRWVNRRHQQTKEALDAAKVAEFVQRRDAIIRSLAPERRERYTRLTLVCRDIEIASADNLLAATNPETDPRLRKLDELMWTYLRLLGIEQSLQNFLETEQRDDVPSLVREAEAEIARLNTELETLKTKGSSAFDTKQRFLSSRMDRLEVLRKRRERTDQARANLELVLSEQERLDQQIKLIRADAVASKNAETLTARIDATVEHLDQTNKWLSELDEFKDLVGDMPATELRVGYQAAPLSTPAPPPIPDPQLIRRAPPLRRKQPN